MQLVVSGILTDYLGRVLLQQTGAKSLSPVRRALERGVLPADTLARAFREETGLIVMPVRLVALRYDAGAPGGELNFWFRCTMRGGDLETSAGGKPAGFFDPPLPAALPEKDRRQVDLALHHAGGQPVMEEAPARFGVKLGRLLSGRKTAPEADHWRVETSVLAQPVDAPIDWVIAEPDAPDAAPASDVASVGHSRPPWATARRLEGQAEATDSPTLSLARVELAPNRPVMTLVFAPRGDE